jgi:cytochrome c oxidase cbb3-type subunit III
MLRLSRLCLALIVAALLNGQDQPPRRYSPWPDYPADVVQRGHDQFQKTCAFCHGANATGSTSGPNLVQSALVRHDENGNLLAPVVRQGRPEKGMPAFPFNDTQISEISVFLHSRLKASDLKSAGRPSEQYSLDKLLVGKADAGKAFFNGAGKCAACHSVAGDLAGIARKYAPIDLQSRFLYPPDRAATATITDSSGKQHTGSILLLTNYDVAIRDAGGWYRSWPLDAITLKVNDPLAGHLELLSKYTDADMHNVFAYLETLK